MRNQIVGSNVSKFVEEVRAVRDRNAAKRKAKLDAIHAARIQAYKEVLSVAETCGLTEIMDGFGGQS